MADPSEEAGGRNTSTEDPEENKTWDELFVHNPDEYFGNTNSRLGNESRPKICDPKEAEAVPARRPVPTTSSH